MLTSWTAWPIVSLKLMNWPTPYTVSTKKKKKKHNRLTLILEVKVTQSCLTLCDSMDYRVHGIL